MTVSEAEWGTRATRLADELVRTGALSDPGWYDAFAATPRHHFVPSFVDGASIRERDESTDPAGWLDSVYSDEALLTHALQRQPTSSSSKPTIMAVMLSLLDMSGSARVLEIGTGTGYNAALLAHRVGDEQVTTLDIDPGLVDAARRRLAELGLRPALRTVDGSAGCAERAPFDRIIATCAIGHVPPAWIRQLADGGRIVAPLTGLGGGLMVLDKTAPDEVVGRFDPRPALFMPLRPRADDPLGPGETLAFGHAGMPHYGSTALDPEVLTAAEPALALFCRLYLPGLRIAAERGPDSALVVHTAEAMAEVRRTPLRSGCRQVLQRGSHRPWDTVEVAVRDWHELGQPGHHRLGITALDCVDRQYVWLDDPDGMHSWPLR